MEYKKVIKKLETIEHIVTLSVDDLYKIIKDKLPHVDLNNTYNPIEFAIKDFGAKSLNFQHRGCLYPGKNSRVIFTFIERQETLELEI